MMFWILCIQVHNGLAHGRRKRPLIKLLNFRRWLWRQETRHSCLVKEIGLVVNRTAWRSCFSRTHFHVNAPQNHGPDQLIFDLGRIFEQWTNLRPFMRWDLSLVSAFGHSSPFISKAKPTPMQKHKSFLMSILPGFGCPDKVLEVFSPTDRKGICQAGRGEVSPILARQAIR